MNISIIHKNTQIYTWMNKNVHYYKRFISVAIDKKNAFFSMSTDNTYHSAMQ